MEIQLQELIDQIKKDGVEAAESEASSILDSAKAEAEKIIADAKAEADRILTAAKTENERMVKVSEESIRQAGRNMILTFRESVTKEINAIIGDEVRDVYSSEALPQLIVNVIKAWTENTDAEEVSLLLNSKDLSALESTLLAAAKDKLAKGVTLKANDSFDLGFRIAVNDGKAYYDYSSESVTELLSSYLSPKVLALLKEAEGV